MGAVQQDFTIDKEIAQLHTEFEKLSLAFQQEPYPSIESRAARITQLKESIIEHKQALADALSADYGYRSPFDTLLSDIVTVCANSHYTLKNLKKWTKPQRRHSGLLLMPSSVHVYQQPLGIVGIITPWNFPVNLSMNPTITALAAGNRVMLKMSEFTPNTNQVLRQVLKPLEDHIVLIEGEAEISSAFSRLKFDHLFFTGSTAVGKHIAHAATDNLTPITLELGGKSPTIIDNKIDMKSAVDAILTGKSINSGQICVAPDYVFLPKEREQEFIKMYRDRFNHFYASQKQDSGYGCIIDQRQYDRLQGYLSDAVEKGAKLHPMEAPSTGENFLPPTLVTEVDGTMEIMQHEIFGSLLPIMTYDKIEQVYDYINKGERPLALYLMSDDKALIEKTLKQTHSGGVAINDTLFHVAADDAPFGGIGHSGMGSYHGIEGFKTFSHSKTVLKSASWLPRSAFLLKHRDLAAKVLGKLFVR
ncbi:coniferyl aldehyde dehydrogenase [Vibrio sp. SCSIO 43136]|uniref:coniferyl aldehyde dehydrogenase n=1 Tax=Vibrio sp. SCSIO 43136 TaxID=2819101 RepID=UPI002074F933|nr:coniferyl aldehyde dehydrogenase [Vibrio sp. SCSIO 43136]USD66912.1 coniferyl aldehyde dehydrogenase [Vibrio sp. SCSIO 43136]